MVKLPEDFIRETRLVMGEERFDRYLEAFNEEAPVSIRINPKFSWNVERDIVPWCSEGYYLSGRPQFTFDPLFHAGCYYVQEAASMFVTHILRQFVKEPVAMLDMNNYPRDFRKAKARFDVILCDVPCSGEGMFRKDPETISEWSLQNVEKCWRLQREIVADAWECLNPGGLLIYSTCTFNTKENEENVRWIISEFDDAEILEIPTEAEWHITGSLLEGFDAPVCRFIPGITKGEGLFICALRKNSDTGARGLGAARFDIRQMKGMSILEPPYHRTTVPPTIELSYHEALRYLRGEALVLPADTPRGIVTITYKGFPLGPAKNIGNRANNLYPKPWRIKTTHLPTEPPQVL